MQVWKKYLLPREVGTCDHCATGGIECAILSTKQSKLLKEISNSLKIYHPAWRATTATTTITTMHDRSLAWNTKQHTHTYLFHGYLIRQQQGFSRDFMDVPRGWYRWASEGVNVWKHAVKSSDVGWTVWWLSWTVLCVCWMLSLTKGWWVKNHICTWF